MILTENKDKILELFERGEPILRIAAELKMDPVHVKMIIKNNYKENDMKKLKKQVSDKKRQNIIEDYKNGMSVNKLCKKYKCGYTNVYYYLQDVEKRKKEPTEMDEEKRKLIIDAYENGMCAYQIYSTYDVTAHLVRKTLKEHYGEYPRELKKKRRN